MARYTSAGAGLLKLSFGAAFLKLSFLKVWDFGKAEELGQVAGDIGIFF